MANVYNPMDRDYQHYYDGNVVFIPAGQVKRHLSEAQAAHVVNHNAELQIVSDELALKGVMVPEAEGESALSRTDHQCPQCKKFFKNAFGLSGHLKSHA